TTNRHDFEDLQQYRWEKKGVAWMEQNVIQDSASLLSLSRVSVSHPRLPLRCLRATVRRYLLRVPLRTSFPRHITARCSGGAERRLGTEEDVAVGMGGFVAVIHQLRVGADLAVVAGDEFEEAQDRALVHGAEDKGRGRIQQGLLIPGEADEAILEVLRPGLLDL